MLFLPTPQEEEDSPNVTVEGLLELTPVSFSFSLLPHWLHVSAKSNNRNPISQHPSLSVVTSETHFMLIMMFSMMFSTWTTSYMWTWGAGRRTATVSFTLSHYFSRLPELIIMTTLIWIASFGNSKSPQLESASAKFHIYDIKKYPSGLFRSFTPSTSLYRVAPQLSQLGVVHSSSALQTILRHWNAKYCSP